ncbi:MAG: hypothetical protein NTY02_19910 [Acidobacteria bacterium]|nr:hypothetical protein [Acidobacteriota bacterium]
MPYLAAAIVASLAGWAIDALIEPYLSMGTTFVVSGACSTVIFFIVRQWLIDLRGR